MDTPELRQSYAAMKAERDSLRAQLADHIQWGIASTEELEAVKARLAAAQQHIIDREDDEGAEVRTRASVPAMTLRDVFAAAALTGCLAYSRINPMRGNYHENATPDQVAESVYQYADAMLAARAARGERL